MSNNQLPPGIIAVHRNYNPDKERMVKALRIVLASAAKAEAAKKKDAI